MTTSTSERPKDLTDADVVNFLSGTKFLMSRLMSNAITTLRKFPKRRDRGDAGRDAYRWFKGEPALINFEGCCEFLDLDKDVIREKAKALWDGGKYPRTKVDSWIPLFLARRILRSGGAWDGYDWISYFVRNRIRWERIGKMVKVRLSDILLLDGKRSERSDAPGLYQSIFYLWIDGLPRAEIARRLKISDKLTFQAFNCLGIDHD